MSISKIGAKIIDDPMAAKRMILEALEAAEGDRKTAAKALGTTHRSLYRFFDRLNLWDEIDALIREKGFPHIPGPPRLRARILVEVVAHEGDLTKAARALDEMGIRALRARITELNLWHELNRELSRRGFEKISRTKRADAA